MGEMNAANDAATATKSRRVPLRFGAFRQDPEHGRALERVKLWARESLDLADDDTVLVAEVVCARPGCPPLETVVTFWTGRTERHWFKIFKPVAEVAFDDLPPAWLKDALYAADPVEGACC
jgi:nitrate reductase delta subunit